MAKRMDAVTESVDGSHAAFIAHPDVAAGSFFEPSLPANGPPCRNWPSGHRFRWNASHRSAFSDRDQSVEA